MNLNHWVCFNIITVYLAALEITNVTITLFNVSTLMCSQKHSYFSVRVDKTYIFTQKVSFELKSNINDCHLHLDVTEKPL